MKKRVILAMIGASLLALIAKLAWDFLAPSKEQNNTEFVDGE